MKPWRDLRGSKSDKQAKNDTKGLQHTGRDRLERARSLAHCKEANDGVDHRHNEIGENKTSNAVQATGKLISVSATSRP